ncbi:MAG: methyltransferase domain-containing protein [Lachnospiraceae bacterium]|nr:methyltransferase domain-containing protein [Lachnospiraceae bacterium]
MEKAIVFGTGNYYKTKRSSIAERYEIIGFIDNSIKPGGEESFEDKRKLNPIEGIQEWKNEFIILASAKFEEMFMQLRDLGANSRAVLCVDMVPPYDPFEEGIVKSDYSIRVVDDSLVIEGNGQQLVARTDEDWQAKIRQLYDTIHPEIHRVKRLPLEPISRRYGRERGTPIDRYYIEKFLNIHRDVIHGDVAEFADDSYTKKFGQNVVNSYVLHVNGWGENVIKVDLVTGKGVQDNMVDCLICTQVFQFIYNVDAAVGNVYRILKSGGTALITAHGIAQISLYDYRNWGEFWRFTEMSLKKQFEPIFGAGNVEVRSYGNVKIAVAMLYGLCVEDLSIDEFDYADEQYPVILTVMVRKR